MNQQEHLNETQIEQYARTDSVPEPGNNGNRDQIEAHLEDCAPCRERVLTSVRMRFGLVGDTPVKVPPNLDPPGPDCPDEDVLRDVAAGIYNANAAKANDAAKLVEHAAQCSRCGPILRMYTEDFSDELTADDKAVLGGMKGSTPDGQKKRVETILAASAQSSSIPARKTFAWRWMWAPAALGACAAIAFAVWYQQRETPEKVEKLLAQAYVENRTIELRIPGADYAPLRQARGNQQTGSGVADRSPALLAAELTIDKKLRSDPNDTDWLEERALASLLERQFNDAIDDLETAQARRPRSPLVLTLLGIAHYERARSGRFSETQNRPSQTLADNDCVMATENLSQALQVRPGDRVALYNLAFAHTCLNAYKSAIADWEAYLKLDDSSPWATEAKKQLVALRSLVLSYDQRRAEPLIIPTALTGNEIRDGPSLVKIDLRIEDYLDLAVKDWLPALPMSSNRNAPSVQSAALSSIAENLNSLHQDSWLAEILRLPPSNGLHLALETLIKAIQANESGNPEAALETARQAEALFKEIGSEAGVARSKFERLYALRRAVRQCYSPAKQFLAAPNLRRYKWILIQGRLEFSSCAALAGKVGEAERFAINAIDLAAKYGFPALHLRGLAFKASLQRTKGAFFEAWSEELSGLRLYWSGTYPPIRAYLLYTDLSFVAEDAGLWHVACAMQDEAVQQITKTRNTATIAMARTRFANLSLMANETAAADREYKLAGAIFSSLPDVDSTRTYSADAQLGLAKIEASRGETRSAIARLDRISAAIQQISSQTVARRYQVTLAELEYRRGNKANARNLLSKAIDIGEFELASLATEKDRLTWERENGKAYRLLAQLKLDDNEPEHALALWESYRAVALQSQYRGSSIPMAGAPRQSGPKTEMASLLAQTRATMAHESLLTYAMLPGGLTIWLSDDRGLTVVQIAADNDALSTLATQFAAECAHPGSDLPQLNTHAHQLYDLLYKPVSSHLTPERTLLIELDDNLSPIPFQALLDDQNRFLGVDFRFVYSPGLGFYLRRRPMNATRPEELVVGSTATNRFAPRYLVDAEDEAKAVAGYLPAATLLIGREATLDTVLRKLRTASIFHFVGHGVSLEYGTHVGLLLFGDTHDDIDGTAILDASLLRSIRLDQCQLVVLSACSTAKSGRGGFADPDSLVRAFLYAGAHHVIASHWDVDSTTTTRFMASFYDSLRTGKSVSWALRDTQNQLRAEFPHPYYWASFNAFGIDDMAPNLGSAKKRTQALKN